MTKKNKLYYNIIRTFCKDIINKNMKEQIIGMYYYSIHGIIMCMGIYILLFSKNLFYLCILVVVATCDAFAIIVLHQCPLTMLEHKYLGKNITEERMKLLNKLGIVYKCNHVYEYHLELLINIISLITIKLFFIISLNVLKNQIIYIV